MIFDTRYITQDRSFVESSSKDINLSKVCADVLQKSVAIFETIPRTGNEYYFIDFALSVRNLCASLNLPIICAVSGSLRQNLRPCLPREYPVDRLNWAFKLLHPWLTNNLQEEQAETQRILASIKDPQKKDEKKKEIEKMIRDIKLCVRCSIEYLIRTCRVFYEDRVPQSLVDLAISTV